MEKNFEEMNVKELSDEELSEVSGGGIASYLVEKFMETEIGQELKERITSGGNPKVGWNGRNDIQLASTDKKSADGKEI